MTYYSTIDCFCFISFRLPWPSSSEQLRLNFEAFSSSRCLRIQSRSFGRRIPKRVSRRLRMSAPPNSGRGPFAPINFHFRRRDSAHVVFVCTLKVVYRHTNPWGRNSSPVSRSLTSKEGRRAVWIFNDCFVFLFSSKSEDTWVKFPPACWSNHSPLDYQGANPPVLGICRFFETSLSAFKFSRSPSALMIRVQSIPHRKFLFSSESIKRYTICQPTGKSCFYSRPWIAFCQFLCTKLKQWGLRFVYVRDNLLCPTLFG